MSDISVRTLTSDEFRVAHSLFRRALHSGPATDEDWVDAAGTYEPGRTLGAFQDDVLVGTTGSFHSRLAVPGGAQLPMSAVSRVGVRADRTRRGAVSALMRRQLSEAAANGDVVASLRASEATIYGRFGYGVASRARHVSVRTAGLSLRPAEPATVRMLEAEAAEPVLPKVYERIGLHRPGMIARPPAWWRLQLRRGPVEQRPVVVVHTGADGEDDGFAIYNAEEHRAANSIHFGNFVVTVADLQAATPEVGLALWRYLLGLDLAAEVRGRLRPVDEPLEWLPVNRRAVHTTGVDDETWLRLVDVGAALAARRYGEAAPVVVEVADVLLPANEGRYRIGPGGVERVREQADLVLDVAGLASLYLGDVRPSTLAQAGVLRVADPSALARADVLFAVDTVPWCGTFF